MSDPASSLEVDASAEFAFSVITDARAYPDWLVGARAIRGVDPDWPAEGSSFRHVIGVPPILVPGSSTVHLLEPPSRFVLRAGMGPFGAALVEFRVSELAADRSRIEIGEQFVAGPAGWSWRWVRPLVATLVWGRNVVSLQALRARIELADLDVGARRSPR